MMKQNGKTIKQIADEIGVSKQAVYKRFKGKLHTEVLPYVHMEQDTVYISEQGETIIKKDFKKGDTFQEPHTEAHTNAAKEAPLYAVIDGLMEQIKSQQKTIDSLTEALRAEQTLHAESKGMLQTSEQQLITDGSATSEDKPTFKDRLKYLFKGER